MPGEELNNLSVIFINKHRIMGTRVIQMGSPGLEAQREREVRYLARVPWSKGERT